MNKIKFKLALSILLNLAFCLKLAIDLDSGFIALTSFLGICGVLVMAIEALDNIKHDR